MGAPYPTTPSLALGVVVLPLGKPRLRETLTHLDNAAHPQAGRPVFAIIDTETTGFNKRYDRIIELAVARFDESFRLVDQWHTLINLDGKQIKNSHIHGITNDGLATLTPHGSRRSQLSGTG
ncbi:3'-5' exonuclease [Corynebacterium sp. KPL4035]|uniref:3'-5' exonuclease n=1 Tax=Corynebacterium TaxID=1716 RepID=UPI002D808D40|nr:3'-5' exonuclease [Corynebacterium macginleyi]